MLKPIADVTWMPIYAGTTNDDRSGVDDEDHDDDDSDVDNDDDLITEGESVQGRCIQLNVEVIVRDKHLPSLATMKQLLSS